MIIEKSGQGQELGNQLPTTFCCTCSAPMELNKPMQTFCYKDDAPSGAKYIKQYKSTQNHLSPGRDEILVEISNLLSAQQPRRGGTNRRQHFFYKDDAPSGAKIYQNTTSQKSRQERNLGRNQQPHIRPIAPGGGTKIRRKGLPMTVPLLWS